MAPLNVSVLGMGMSATVFHIPFILSLPQYFKLHSVFERSATASSGKAKQTYIDSGKIPNLKVVNKVEEVVKDEAVNVVVITTPNDTHEAYAEAALNNGKHLIVEKPSFITSDVAKRIFDLAKQKGKLIAVFQNRRFDGDYLTLKKLTQSGVFGDLSEVETHYDRFRPGVTGGGIWKESPSYGHGALFDLGTHLVDQIIDLYGFPTQVSSTWLGNSRAAGDKDFLDSFAAVFYYPKGPQNEVPGQTSTLPFRVTATGGVLSAMEPQLRYLIKGKKASWVKWGLDTQEPQLKLGMAPKREGDFGMEPRAHDGALTLTTSKDGLGEKRIIPTERGDYLGWYEATGEALTAGDQSKLVVSPKEAIGLLQLIEAIFKSESEGGRRVNVEL